MGLNTIHRYADDFMVSENLTNKTQLRANPLPNINYKRLDANGILYNKITIALRSNGWCNVSVGDKIQTPLYPHPLKVVAVFNNYDNQLEFKHRKDVENFTGSSDIYLE